MNIINISNQSEFTTEMSSIAADTIYVITQPWTYAGQVSINQPCVAIVASVGWVVLTWNIGMSSSQTIIDNIQIDWANIVSLGFISNSTIHAVQVYNSPSDWLHIGGWLNILVENFQSYNNNESWIIGYGRTDVIIQNYILTGNSGNWLMLEWSNQNVRLSSGYIANNHFVGMYLTTSSIQGLNITDHLVHNNTWGGIFVLNANDWYIQNIEIYDNGPYGLLLLYTNALIVNNVTSYHHIGFGAFGGLLMLESKNNYFNNIVSFDNDMWGIVLLEWSDQNKFTNIQVYNNNMVWFRIDDSRANAVHNILAYNNLTWIEISSSNGWGNADFNAINNFAVFNNTTWVWVIMYPDGDALKTNVFNNGNVFNNNIWFHFFKASDNIINQISIYNNITGITMDIDSEDNLYYGDIYMFENGTDLWWSATQSSNLDAAITSHPNLWWNPWSIVNNPTIPMTCNRAIQVTNISGQDLHNYPDCDDIWIMWWSGSIDARYTFFPYIQKQVPPVDRQPMAALRNGAWGLWWMIIYYDNMFVWDYTWQWYHAFGWHIALDETNSLTREDSWFVYRNTTGSLDIYMTGNATGNYIITGVNNINFDGINTQIWRQAWLWTHTNFFFTLNPNNDLHFIRVAYQYEDYESNYYGMIRWIIENNIQVTKQSNVATIEPGNTIMYTITIQNQTGDAWTGTLIDYLPYGINTGTIETSPSGNYSGSINAIIWDIPYLSGNTTYTFQLTATVLFTYTGNSLVNTATYISDYTSYGSQWSTSDDAEVFIKLGGECGTVSDKNYYWWDAIDSNTPWLCNIGQPSGFIATSTWYQWQCLGQNGWHDSRMCRANIARCDNGVVDSGSFENGSFSEQCDLWVNNGGTSWCDLTCQYQESSICNIDILTQPIYAGSPVEFDISYDDRYNYNIDYGTWVTGTNMTDIYYDSWVYTATLYLEHNIWGPSLSCTIWFTVYDTIDCSAFGFDISPTNGTVPLDVMASFGSVAWYNIVSIHRWDGNMQPIVSWVSYTYTTTWNYQSAFLIESDDQVVQAWCQWPQVYTYTDGVCWTATQSQYYTGDTEPTIDLCLSWQSSWFIYNVVQSQREWQCIWDNGGAVSPTCSAQVWFCGDTIPNGTEQCDGQLGCSSQCTWLEPNCTDFNFVVSPNTWVVTFSVTGSFTPVVWFDATQIVRWDGNDTSIALPITQYTHSYTDTWLYQAALLVQNQWNPSITGQCIVSIWASACGDPWTIDIETLEISVTKTVQNQNQTIFPNGLVPYIIQVTNTSTQARLDNVTIVDLISDNMSIGSYFFEYDGTIYSGIVNTWYFVIDSNISGLPSITLDPQQSIEIIVYAQMDPQAWLTGNNYAFAGGTWVPLNGESLCTSDGSDPQCSRNPSSQVEWDISSRSSFTALNGSFNPNTFSVCAETTQWAPTSPGSPGTPLDPDVSIEKTLLGTYAVAREDTVFLLDLTFTNMYPHTIDWSGFSLTDYFSGGIGISGWHIVDIQTASGVSVPRTTGTNEYNIDLSWLYAPNVYTPACQVFSWTPADHTPGCWTNQSFGSPQSSYLSCLPPAATASGYQYIQRYTVTGVGLDGIQFYPGVNDQWFSWSAVRSYFHTQPHDVMLCQTAPNGVVIDQIDNLQLVMTINITDPTLSEQNPVCNEVSVSYAGTGNTDDACFDLIIPQYCTLMIQPDFVIDTYSTVPYISWGYASGFILSDMTLTSTTTSVNPIVDYQWNIYSSWDFLWMFSSPYTFDNSLIINGQWTSSIDLNFMPYSFDATWPFIWISLTVTDSMWYQATYETPLFRDHDQGGTYWIAWNVITWSTVTGYDFNMIWEMLSSSTDPIIPSNELWLSDVGLIPSMVGIDRYNIGINDVFFLYTWLYNYNNTYTPWVHVINLNTHITDLNQSYMIGHRTYPIACVMIGEVCGDGVPEWLEQCDNGNDNWLICDPNGQSCTYCSNTCQLITVDAPYCGDGIVNQSSEQCDDGNQDDYDGCTTQCLPTDPQCQMVILQQIDPIIQYHRAYPLWTWDTGIVILLNTPTIADGYTYQWSLSWVDLSLVDSMQFSWSSTGTQAQVYVSSDTIQWSYSFPDFSFQVGLTISNGLMTGYVDGMVFCSENGSCSFLTYSYQFANQNVQWFTVNGNYNSTMYLQSISPTTPTTADSLTGITIQNGWVTYFIAVYDTGQFLKVTLPSNGQTYMLDQNSNYDTIPFQLSGNGMSFENTIAVSYYNTCVWWSYCGDGVMDSNDGEECDLWSANGQPNSGCSASCQLTSVSCNIIWFPLWGNSPLIVSLAMNPWLPWSYFDYGNGMTGTSAVYTYTAWGIFNIIWYTPHPANPSVMMACPLVSQVVVNWPCSNGATNPPLCNQCASWQYYCAASNQCITAGWTCAWCTNGAINFPACNVCWQGQQYCAALNQCILDTETCPSNQCEEWDISGVSSIDIYATTWYMSSSWQSLILQAQLTGDQSAVSYNWYLSPIPSDVYPWSTWFIVGSSTDQSIQVTVNSWTNSWAWLLLVTVTTSSWYTVSTQSIIYAWSNGLGGMYVAPDTTSINGDQVTYNNYMIHTFWNITGSFVSNATAPIMTYLSWWQFAPASFDRWANGIIDVSWITGAYTKTYTWSQYALTNVMSNHKSIYAYQWQLVTSTYTQCSICQTDADCPHGYMCTDDGICELEVQCFNAAINPPLCTDCGPWKYLCTSLNQCRNNGDPCPWCSNGAINYPICNQCGSWQYYCAASQQCILEWWECAWCANGAINFPACNQCGAGQFYCSATQSCRNNGQSCGGWWGGWGWLSMDYCPNGDFSWSYYDGKCGEPQVHGSAPVGKFCIYDDEEYLARWSFDDIFGHWWELPIEIMRVSCLHRGRHTKAGLRRYEPNANIQRDEVLKTLVKIVGIEFEDFSIKSEELLYTGVIPFADVAYNNRFSHYANYAFTRWLTQWLYSVDSAKNYLSPTKWMTRYEATKAIVTAYEKMHWTIVIQSAPASKIVDVPTADPNSIYVRKAEVAWLIQWYPQANGTFLFKWDGSITRAEFAKIIAAAFNEQLIDVDEVVVTSKAYNMIVQSIQKVQWDRLTFIRNLFDKLKLIDEDLFLRQFKIQKDVFIKTLADKVLLPMVNQ
jgi:cysteine-rich repeat protein